jgi:hypothetical protein
MRCGNFARSRAVKVASRNLGLGLAKPVPRIDTLVKLKFSLGVSAEDLLAGMVWTPGDFRRGGFGVGES